MLFTWPQSCESFVAKSGLFSSLPNPLPYFGGLSFTAACQSSGSWEGNEAEELRRRAPHCEGNVDSQPMHFNAGKLPAKPEGCAWAPGSPAFCSSTGLELMPSFPPGLGSCRNLSTTTGCPPANRRATVPLLTFHKHLLTEQRPESWQSYLKSTERPPPLKNIYHPLSWCLDVPHVMWIPLNPEEFLLLNLPSRIGCKGQDPLKRP